MANQLPALSNQKAEIYKVFKSGISFENMAQRFGIGKTTMRNKVRELGLKRKRVYKSKFEGKKELILAYEAQGLTYKEIAHKLGVHPTNLLRFRKYAGIYKENKELSARVKQGKAIAEQLRAKGIEHKPNWCRLDAYIDEIVELLEKGATKTDIAKKYKVCPATVHNLLKIHDIQIKTKKKLELKRRSLLKLYSLGHSYVEIAKRLNVSADLVFRTIKELGIERKHPVKKLAKLAVQEKQIVKLFNKGLSYREIAEKIGCHLTSVSIKAKKMGLKRDFATVKQPSLLDGKYNQIKQMLKKGYTQKYIAQTLGIKPNTLLYHIQKKGLKNG